MEMCRGVMALPGAVYGEKSVTAGAGLGKVMLAGLVTGGVVVVGCLVLWRASKWWNKKAVVQNAEGQNNGGGRRRGEEGGGGGAVEEQEEEQEDSLERKRQNEAKWRLKTKQEYEQKKTDKKWQDEGQALVEQAKIDEDWGKPFQEPKEKIKEYVTNTNRMATKLDNFFKGDVTAAMNNVTKFDKGTGEWVKAVGDTEKLIKDAQWQAIEMEGDAIKWGLIANGLWIDLRVYLQTEYTEDVNHRQQWAKWQWDELRLMRRLARATIEELEDWLFNHGRSTQRRRENLGIKW